MVGIPIWVATSSSVTPLMSFRAFFRYGIYLFCSVARYALIRAWHLLDKDFGGGACVRGVSIRSSRARLLDGSCWRRSRLLCGCMYSDGLFCAVLMIPRWISFASQPRDAVGRLFARRSVSVVVCSKNNWVACVICQSISAAIFHWKS